MKKPVKKRSIRFAIVLSLAIAISCQQPEIVPTPPPPSQDGTPVLEYILALGFQERDIEDAGDRFIVEGDIIFKKDLVISKDELKELGNGRTKQYYTGRLVSTANRSNIRIYVDGSVAPYSWLVPGAVAHWNNVLNTSIRFTIVGSGEDYDIIIKSAVMPYDVCGRASFAVSGVAGPLVELNTSFFPEISNAQRQATIIHELGHAIGFRHTDWAGSENQVVVHNGITYDAINVPGVGGTDAASLMNSGGCGTGPTSLSTHDRLATAALYPIIAQDFYIVKSGIIYGTDQSTGISLDISEGWNSTVAMAATGGYIYTVTDGAMYRINPSDHSATYFSDDPNNWAGTEAMAAVGGSLYVVKNGSLWRVTISNGDITPYSDYPNGWAGTQAMAASSGALYVVQGGSLWQVNFSNEDVTPFSDYPDGWTGTEAMTLLGSNLYMVQGGTLWQVNLGNQDVVPFSNYPQGWEGTAAMTAKDGHLYVSQAGALWDVNVSTQGVTQLGLDNWSGTESMAARL